MANAIKILGQVAPGATSLTDLYTVPAATSTVVSSIVICNRDSGAATFRIAVAAAGADNDKNYLYYDVALLGNDTFVATIGITLGATDKIKVYASTANLSFSVFGQEVS